MSMFIRQETGKKPIGLSIETTRRCGFILELFISVGLFRPKWGQGNVTSGTDGSRTGGAVIPAVRSGRGPYIVSFSADFYANETVINNLNRQ